MSTVWLFGAAATTSAGDPVNVLVKAREEGQGLLVSRLDACYAITAKHVMRDRVVASLIGGRDNRRTGEGQLLRAFADDDIALLRVTGALVSGCGGTLEDATALEGVIVTRALAALAKVFDDGGVGRMPLIVTDVGPQFLRVAPASANDRLVQGMSGGLVTIGDRPAGMLLAVEASGEGKVIRYDRVAGLVKQFLARPAELVVTPPIGGASGEIADASNLLAAARGARVLRWSAVPTQPENGPTNLIAATRIPWLSTTRDLPVDVDFELAGGRASTIRRIELDSAGVEPRMRLPRDFEILFSVSSLTAWTPLHSGTFFTQDARRAFDVAPVRARYIKLRIHSNWGDPNTVGLGAVRIYGE